MSLKVFDLQCGNGHIFEGWFSATNSFEEQSAKRLLDCPVCGDDTIERKLSAPRLNLGKGSADVSADAGHGGHPSAESAHADSIMSSPQLAQFQARVLQQMRTLVKNSEDVGASFANEALKIHQGTAQDRAIRGTATAKERRELRDEGVPVLAIPDFLDDDQLQ